MIKSKEIAVSLSLGLILLTGCGGSQGAPSVGNDSGLEELYARDKSHDVEAKKALEKTIGAPVKEIVYTLDNQGAFIVRVDDESVDYPHTFVDYYDISDLSNPALVRQIGNYHKTTKLVELVTLPGGFLDIYETDSNSPVYQRTYDYNSDKYLFTNYEDDYSDTSAVKGQINQDIGGNAQRMVFFPDLHRMAVSSKNGSNYEISIYDTQSISKLYTVATLNDTKPNLNKVREENHIAYYKDGNEAIFDLEKEEVFVALKDEVKSEIISMSTSEDEKALFVVREGSGKSAIVDYYDASTPSNPIFKSEIGSYAGYDVQKIQPLANDMVNLYLTSNSLDSSIDMAQLTWNYKNAEPVFSELDVLNQSTKEGTLENLIVVAVEESGESVVDMAYLAQKNTMMVIVKKSNGQKELVVYDASSGHSVKRVASLLKASDISDVHADDNADRFEYRVDGVLKTYTTP